MPSDLVHYTFVKENIANDDKFYRLTALAGQGPDVFFFYGYNFKKRQNGPQIRRFGTLLHHTDIAPLYNHLLEYANNSEHKDMLYAFIKGLFIHYLVDRNCHPYIFYRTGFSDDPQLSKYYSFQHVWFESILDFEFSKSHGTYRSSVKNIRCKKEEVKEVSKMFYDLAQFMNIKEINEDSYYLGYKDMKLVKKIAFSRFGIKKSLFKLFLKNNTLNALSMPCSDKKYRKYDIMNVNKNEWKDCVNGGTRSESFEELFNNAKKELFVLNTILEKSYNGENVLDDLKLFVNEIDHDGFNYKAKKQYFELFIEGKEKQ